MSPSLMLLVDRFFGGVLRVIIAFLVGGAISYSAVLTETIVQLFPSIMQVSVSDPDKRLSKTQMQRFTKAVRESFSADDPQGSIRPAFEGIHYQEGTPRYAAFDVSVLNDDSIMVYLLAVDKRRIMLKQRLRNAIRQKNHHEVDPSWKQYQQLCKQVDRQLPDPDEVKRNRDVYVEMAARMDPAKHPVAAYFMKCLDE